MLGRILKSFALVAVPSPVVIVIGPELAWAGTTATISRRETMVKILAA